MPPLFTSTSWTTLVRKVASAARQVHQPAVQAAARTHAPGPSQGSLRSGVRRAQLALRNVIRQSFPSLGTPYSQLGYAVQPIHISRGAPRAGPSSSRYGSTMAFRTAYRLPRHVPSAAHMTGQVGLGSARTFASGPASNVYISNVPLGFRALVKLVDKDDEYGKTLPRPRRYRPYRREQLRRLRKTAIAAWNPSIDSRSTASFESCEGSIDSTLLSGISHYFPFRPRTSAFVPIPICPEELVTPGKTTTLSLPLSPDLHALLDPTPLMSYEQAEVGSKVMSDLCQGLLTMEEAFDMYRQACVHPLLAHLEALDVLRLVDTRLTRVEGLVLRDGEGRPDVLRLVFYGRSIEDVRRILATTLEANERGEEWWTMYESNQTAQALNPAESAAILEDWSDQPAPSAPLPPIPMMDQSVVDVILPTLEIGQSFASAQETWPASEQSSPESSFLPTPAYDPNSPISLPSDGFSTPISDDSFPASLTASLLSSLNESTSSSWHVQPSADDIEVESMISFSSTEAIDGEPSEVWSVADVQEETSGPPSPSAFARWSGTGQGFGMPQPW